MSDRLLSGLFIGQDTLVSHGLAIATIADNLANQNTPGFKDSRVDFADILADSVGSLYGGPVSGGSGVKPEAVTVLQKQGLVQLTGRDLDFAIDGNGFFVVNDGTSNFYTRAGNFTADANGMIVAPGGESLMGFTAASPTQAVALSVNNLASTATATAAVTITGNLDSTAPIDALAPAFQSAITVIDSLGASHDIGLNFFHTGAGAWTVQAQVDGAEVGGTAGAPTVLGTTTMNFDQTGSQGVGATTTLSVSPAWVGASAGTVAINVGALTSLSGGSGFQSVSADGSAPGQVTGFEVRAGGKLVALLDNGKTADVGTVVIAAFNNPGGLEKVGDNKYAETVESGAPEVDAAELDGRGAIRSSSLESSTVDPAEQFTDMVRFQRGYQAGSKIIQTVNELLNKTIELA